MPIVVDASVALKLVTPEAGTAEEQALLERSEERIAPDWMLVEAAGGLANKMRRRNWIRPVRGRRLRPCPHSSIGSCPRRHCSVAPCRSRPISITLYTIACTS
ncbi:type II toxin-antitoxin system VapC family toxin [Sphingomonas sp. LY54]|uniref:type II toxin-antitoxin system VapC family toxin n=1 Tax=Sphingomonas sp. LY54 TaxID=3095343 RepID=UPI002D77AE56|nr:type II toxin-antitoxin system VapC family toxin [Sphingomonas sp. LY54]WRP28805.1 type II toxin-antitoxin system VapC family toxin [Sphingomonas sp. LY54]